MTSVYFTAKTLDELKQEYRKLAIVFHPDRGGDTETMQQINAEYEALNKFFASQEFDKAEDITKAENIGAEMAATIQKIAHIPKIEIEICGAWLWVSGNTYEYKAIFKENGFLWSKNKQAWHWHLPEDGSRWGRGKYSMEEIRSKYGTSKVKGHELPRLN